MNRSFIIFFLLFLSTIEGYTQSNNSKYEGVILLDALFESSIEKYQIPAAVAYISIGGKEVYHKAYGLRNIEDGISLERTDIFRIASMTKVVTAVAVMQLYEQGMLLLDDPISKYLPEFENPRILVELNSDSSFSSSPAEGEITIRHLLTHTGGIGYGFQSESYNAMVVKNGISEGFEERPISLRDNTKEIAKLPLLQEPGEKWTYSLSYDVLGSLIEVVSSESLDDYFYNYIIGPLGMNDTYFYLPEEKANRLVTVYEHNKTKNGFVPTTYEFTAYPVAGAKMYLSAGADLSSTARDIAIFAQTILNKGVYQETRILSSRSVELMTMPQMVIDSWDTYMGFSFSVTNKKGAIKGPFSEGSMGWGGFYDTYCWIDPKYDLVAVLLLQMYPNNEFKFHERFEAVTYNLVD